MRPNLGGQRSKEKRLNHHRGRRVRRETRFATEVRRSKRAKNVGALRKDAVAGRRQAPPLQGIWRLVFSADWGRGYRFFGFFGVVHGVAGAFYGVVEVVFVDVDVNFVGGDFVQGL